jgi:putative flavoprotein involved in K+ transport
MSTVDTVDTVVIGAGQAGLAVSRLLTEAGRDHVVLERGRVGERWRTERWDSLRLLSPNWMTRLPDWRYRGPDDDGFMTAQSFTHYLEDYANSFAAPVVGGVTVEHLSAAGDGYRVVTDGGSWRCRHVVVATGPHGTPHAPVALRGMATLHSSQYRNPGKIPPGAVLVVGGSSSGVQIADELNAAGREVVLSVGGHTRMPRTYRGMDVFWWLETTGRLARTIDHTADPAAARREPSMQLVGRPEGAPLAGDIDLPALQARGVRLAGRLDSLDRGTVTFRDDLLRTTAAADERMFRFLNDVDEHVARAGLAAEVWPAARPRPFAPQVTPRKLDLRKEGIGSVVVATGYRSDFGWLGLPIVRHDGSIYQRRGVTPAPGVYVVGMRFQHRRDSAFIDGARHDARSVVRHILTGSTDGISLASREPAT